MLSRPAVGTTAGCGIQDWLGEGKILVIGNIANQPVMLNDIKQKK